MAVNGFEIQEFVAEESWSLRLPMLLTPEEAGKLLRKSRKAVYSMVERGQLPGVTRIGRRVLIRSCELLDFLDHNCASSPQENRR